MQRRIPIFMIQQTATTLLSALLAATTAIAATPLVLLDKNRSAPTAATPAAAALHAYEAPDAFGNVIPDFSLAGYRNGGVALPQAAVMETLHPAAGDQDDTARIQAAIGRVALLRQGADGIRGAVLLTKGRYRCNATLRIPPGVILRGQGQDAGGSVIIATMKGGTEKAKPTLIRIEGSGGLTNTSITGRVLDEKVPLGARRMRSDVAKSLRPGDWIAIERNATPKWIHDLKMDQIRLREGGKQWPPAEYQVRWTARVTAVSDDTILLDTPTLCAIESLYGGASVRKVQDTRLGAAAVEDLRLESIYQKGGETSDEDHAWNAITINKVVDCWVRNVTALHFAYSCVSVGKEASRITVQDCAMLDPVSQVTGGRRYSFCGDGSRVLFQRCYARNGRHDFVTGHLDVGPTVFLDCLGEQTHADIGPHHRWACGQLYDNVKGGEINIQDRGGMGTGHGWAGNCQVLWNCAAKSLICQKPWLPSTQNWMIGCVGAIGRPALPGRPDGIRASQGKPVTPRSLYLTQLAARVEREGGKGQQALQATTTAGQRQGTLWDALHQRYANDR